jgi:hypothetical protein
VTPFASAEPLLADAEWAPGFDELGLRAFTTARAAGSFGVTDPDARVADIIGRWDALQQWTAGQGAPRLVAARQVHGTRVEWHTGGAPGWLRGADADGHATVDRGIALAVTIADCVPVFVAHPSGAVALLHAGWRGTAAGILSACVDSLAARGFDPAHLRVHLGPCISGAAYEVGPEVQRAVTGREVAGPSRLDLRATLAEQARAGGVERVTISPACTVGDRPRWFSHRGGDAGRQLAVLVVPSP